MKKLFLIGALALGTVAAQAQVTVEGSKFSDNWSLGLKGGMVTPLTHHSFFPNARGVFGLNLQKQIIPSIGLGIEGEWSINTSSWYANAGVGYKSKNALDHQYVGAYAAFNLMNAFCGYKGAPRFFEIEALAGAGWLHSYNPSDRGGDGNSWATKVGLNFNFNLGESKAWTIGVKPAILWNMGGATKYSGGNLYSYSSQYNANAAVFELLAGVTYHFKNSNGTHSFVTARLYDQAEIDALNAQINNLKNDLENCNAETAALQSKVSNLQAELDACMKRPAEVKEVKSNLNNVRYVFFGFNSSYIAANQKPNLELIANAAKESESGNVTIKGYASAEGSAAYNQRLSQRRADAVKKALVKNYKMDADKIKAEGEGVAKQFSVQSWNRMAICTVE